MAHNCRVCGDELTDDNWKSSRLKKGDYICKKCNKEKNRLYREANPEKAKAGQLSMSENKECAAYLGVYVNERLLKHLFNDVEVMPYGNKGYDFVCGKGYKVDGKSSCLRKDGCWAFYINQNTTSDYFLLVAYDNRKDLNPLHIWLIPGHVLNNLTCTSISESTLEKWAEYEKPINEVISCCNTIKSNGDTHV